MIPLFLSPFFPASQRRDQEPGRALQGKGPRVGRDEEAGALPGAQYGGAGTECSRPVQAEQGVKRVPVRSTFPASGQVQDLRPKTGAIGQTLQRAARNGTRGGRTRDGEAGRARAHDVERLGHVKRAGSPVRPRPTVVEDAVGEVGALLHLGDQNAAPDAASFSSGNIPPSPLHM